MENKKVTIFAMTEKGYAVLQKILPKFKHTIQMVVGSRDGQIKKDFYSEIKSLCQNHNVSFIDRKEFKEIVTQYAIAISWRWIINTDNSNLIVFHDSLLPRYRGFNPLVTALINGDDKIGVTALLATSEYDKGEILAQSSTKINYPITIQEAISKIIKNYEEIALYILETIDNERQFLAKPQKENEATYSLWRDDEDYLINWNKSANEIKRFIDAVGYPYKGAATTMNNQLVRILQAEVVEDVVIENRVPGKVIFIENSYPIVVCGQGLLKIIKIIDDQNETSLIPLPKFRIRFR